MNKINLRYLFLYVLMAVFIAPAVANITRTFGVQPAELTQSQILYSDSIDYFLGGSLLLKNGQTDKYLFDGGYVRSNATTGNFSFFYYNKDHLGNNREVLDHRGAVRQVTSYYPFGAPYADDAAISGTGIQPYKYNGKELDLMHGLNTYDYGARQYYSILGRWDRVDALAEKKPWQSPYVYGKNNPIKFIDPDGNEDFDIFMGYFVGGVTNIIPFGGVFRDMYSPTDANDYNNALQNTDNTFIAMGKSMSNAGKGGMALGTAVAATGGTIIVGTGGTGTAIGGTAVVAGGVLTGVSAVAGITGNILQMSAASNKGGGYNRGKNKSNSEYNSTEAEHKKNTRASTKEKHQKGQSRKAKDKGNEKGDARRVRYK